MSLHVGLGRQVRPGLDWRLSIRLSIRLSRYMALGRGNGVLWHCWRPCCLLGTEAKTRTRTLTLIQALLLLLLLLVVVVISSTREAPRRGL